jgi:hypothetical protein
MENDRLRQILGAIVGIFIIIVLILVAKWAGDRIREKFLAPKPSVVDQTESMPSQAIPTPTPVPTPAVKGTYSSTIPATGPSDFLYPLLGLFLASGFVLRKLTV